MLSMHRHPAMLYILAIVCLVGSSTPIEDRHGQRPLGALRNQIGFHRTEQTTFGLDKFRPQTPLLPFAPAPNPPESHKEKVGFDNEKVLRIKIGGEQLKQILSTIETFNLDLWNVQKARRANGDPAPDHAFLVDVRVPSHYTDSMLARLFADQWEVMIPNLGQMITQNEEQARQEYKTNGSGEDMLPPEENPFHDSYHPWNEICDFMKDLEWTYPDLVRPYVLGQTYQGRNITGIKIGKHLVDTEKKSHPRNESEHVFILQGAQHAREWISPATVLFIAHKLVDDYARGVGGKHPLLEEMSFLVLPTLNVDGYTYTWERNRMWRKNRSPTSFPLCNGVDLNRNWNFKWEDEGGGGSSSNPCSESYRGTKAFEGIEVKAMADYILEGSKAIGEHVVGYLDLHAYSQLLMFPYSYSCSAVASSYENLLEASLGAARALKDVYGTSYVVGPVCDVIYKASGSSIDWTYAVGGVEHSFAAELRDTGTYGFLLPANQIKESGLETFAMVHYLGNFVHERLGL